MASFQPSLPRIYFTAQVKASSMSGEVGEEFKSWSVMYIKLHPFQWPPRWFKAASEPGTAGLSEDQERGKAVGGRGELLASDSGSLPALERWVAWMALHPSTCTKDNNLRTASQNSYLQSPKASAIERLVSQTLSPKPLPVAQEGIMYNLTGQDLRQRLLKRWTARGPSLDEYPESCTVLL